MDFVVTTGVIALVILISWLYGRVLNGGSRLDRVKRQLLTCASVLMAGIGYIMYFGVGARWPDRVVLSIIAAWVLLVVVFGLWRWRLSRQGNGGGS